MPAFTSNLNLYKPGGGSTGTITPDEVVDIDRINSNMDTLDLAVGNPAAQNRQWYGLAAQINTLPVSPKDGDTYQESDGNKILWRRMGGTWVTNEAGLTLIRPSSVVNGVIQSDGAVSFPGTSTSCSLNGVFTSRFRAFKILYCVNVTTNFLIIRARRAGADLTAAGYSLQRNFALGNGTVAAASTPTAVGIDLTPAVSSAIVGEITIVDAAFAGSTTKNWFGQTSYFVSPNTGVQNFGGFTVHAEHLSPYDGFTISASANLPSDSGQSFIKVYGIS